MIESKETGSVINYNSSNIFSNFHFNETKNKYKSVLNSFFKNGASYKGEILLGSIYGNIDSGYLSDPKIGTRSGDEDLDFKLVIKIYSQTLGDGFHIKVYDNADLTGTERFDIDFDTPPILASSDGVTVDSSSWDANTKEFTIYFSFPSENVLPENGFFFTPVDNTGDYWSVKQYQVNTTPSTILPSTHGALPILDCSDFASFLWAATNGNLIKKKVFDCKSLIDETFDYIEDIEKISINGSFISKANLNDVFEDTKNGDIFVFNKNTDYHCITIIDIEKKEYTEVSGVIEFYLGTSYNCQINPYPMKSRIESLMRDSIFYKVRLL